MSIVNLFNQTVPEFIRAAGNGRNMSTGNIGNRFGWDSREAYKRLCELERRGEVVRVGVDGTDIGHSQFWNVPGAERGTKA